MDLTEGALVRVHGKQRHWRFHRKTDQGDLVLWGPLHRDGRPTKYGKWINVREEDIK